MQNLYDSRAPDYEIIKLQDHKNTGTEVQDMNAQTLNEVNHNDTIWQIARLQKASRLKKVICSVVNQRSIH